MTGSSFSQNFGGKGANQAVMAARLGVRTAMCGMVGADGFGDGYRAQLQRESCNVDHLNQCSDRSTGIAQIAVDSKGQNTIVIVPGANEGLSEADIFNFQSVLQSAAVLLCQNEINLSCTIEALKLGRAGKCVTIFNPAPASLDCVAALPYADIVCPNETELALLTSLPTETDSQVITAAAALMERGGGGCGIVIVSLGARGACVMSDNKTASFVSAPVVSAIDSVGAGDCFLGALAGYVSRGLPLLDAVAKAVRCASISVTRKGAQASYPCCNELDSDLKPPTRII